MAETPSRVSSRGSPEPLNAVALGACSGVQASPRPHLSAAYGPSKVVGFCVVAVAKMDDVCGLPT
jgi:hypothetical protein